MNNKSLDIVSIFVEDDSLQMSPENPVESNPSSKTTTDWNSKISSINLLMYYLDNLQDSSFRICQNWLKTHETESLCSKNIRQYTKIVILLQDLVELVERIKIKIQCAQLQRLEISQAVGAIVSNCLDIESKQISPKTNLVNDLGMDSLSWQELLITLEEKFTIEITDEIAGRLETVQEIVDCIVLIVQAKNKQSLQLQLYSGLHIDGGQ